MHDPRDDKSERFRAMERKAVNAVLKKAKSNTALKPKVYAQHSQVDGVVSDATHMPHRQSQDKHSDAIAHKSPKSRDGDWTENIGLALVFLAPLAAGLLQKDKFAWMLVVMLVLYGVIYWAGRLLK